MKKFSLSLYENVFAQAIDNFCFLQSKNYRIEQASLILSDALGILSLPASPARDAMCRSRPRSLYPLRSTRRVCWKYKTLTSIEKEREIEIKGERKIKGKRERKRETVRRERAETGTLS